MPSRAACRPRGDGAKSKTTYEDRDKFDALSDDDDIDETFAALEKLLHTLHDQHAEAHAASTSTTSTTSSSSSSSTPSNRPSRATARVTRDELLAARRRERERCRAMLFTQRRARPHSRTHATRNTSTADSSCEDDDDRESELEPVVSVESAISNRVISGSFSAADALTHVHQVLAPDRRWQEEEEDRERLPVVLMPTHGQFVPPSENPKLNVVLTDEGLVLREQWLELVTKEAQAQLAEGMPAESSRLLTPPVATWYIQMHDLDALQT